MLYSISSSSEVVRKNVQNISCWFSTTLRVTSLAGQVCLLNSKLKHSSVIIRLLRYSKINENQYRKKNTDITDITIFFRDCILLIFMKNLLNFMQKFLFSNYAKQPRYNSFDSSGAWYFHWSVRPVHDQ
jgi:hypothetical protein